MRALHTGGVVSCAVPLSVGRARSKVVFQHHNKACQMLLLVGPRTGGWLAGERAVSPCVSLARAVRLGRLKSNRCW